jgi:hypothetical protein
MNKTAVPNIRDNHQLRLQADGILFPTPAQSPKLAASQKKHPNYTSNLCNLTTYSICIKNCNGEN